MRIPVSTFLLACTPVLHAQWSTPVPMPNVNTAASEFDPSPTITGLTLYFTRQVGTNFELFRATRTAPFTPFGTPVIIPELNTTSTEAGPCARFDDLEIFFYSNRAGGTGSLDIWRATRSSPTAPFGAPVPVSELNTTAGEGGMSLTIDGLTIYYGSNNDIWRATRPNLSAPFASPAPVTELNSSSIEREPHISPDGLTIYFTSARTGGTGGNDTWMATRTSPTQPFGTPVQVAALNTTAADVSPSFAIFSDEIFFTSFRTGGPGSYDLHTARFTGLVANGIAGPNSTQALRFSDPGSPVKPYFAAAALGTSPGIQFGTRVLPLNPDALLFLSAGGFPPILNGYSGALNADGIANGQISFAGFPQFVGLQFYNAFLVLDPSAPLGIKTISNAHAVLVQ